VLAKEVNLEYALSLSLLERASVSQHYTGRIVSTRKIIEAERKPKIATRSKDDFSVSIQQKQKIPKHLCEHLRQ
jgi:hypothetical protein